MSNCLACDNPDLKVCVDLGKQPLANNYGETDSKAYPLKLLYCDTCWHAQLSYFVDPKKLYSQYYYVSGTSNTLREWFEDFASRFKRAGTMLDVASNDGTLMRVFKDKGWNVFGVDPAENIAPDDLNVRTEFFDEHFSEVWRYDLITAFNVLAHGPNPLSVLKGIYRNLKDDGVAYVMTSQGNMFDTGQFDTIYHEHHSFFSPKSFYTLAQRAGFKDVSMTVEPIHGGSLLFRLTKGPGIKAIIGKRPDFEGFAAKVNATRPYKVVGYGAAAKGVVVINALKQQLVYVVDEAPLKIGHNIPGTDIPIVHPNVMKRDKDNLVVIIYAWNFYDEIVDKIKKLRPKRNDIFVRYW